MQRMVLRHLSGSKTNQVEEFPLSYFKELTFGRDPSCSVKYDPDRDDLVGRQHAKITQSPSDPTQFMISDLGSRNGTFVNKQRIVGSTRITVGDVIQFGAGGPEVQFDLEPRPEQLARDTIEAGSPRGIPPTRAGVSGNVPPTRAGDLATTIPITMAGTAPAPSMVGKATVERMISQTKSESRKHMLMGGAALLVVVGIVAGLLFYLRNPAVEPDPRMSAEQIAAANINSVVYIEVSWDLIHTPTGNKVYHQYVHDGVSYKPAYIRFTDGSIEPWLTEDSKTEDGKGENRPIGGTHTGTGFVVGSEGFILTNRHVAAAWDTEFKFPRDAVPGVLFKMVEDENIKDPECFQRTGGSKKVKGTYKYAIGTLLDIARVGDNGKWVPSEAKAFGCQSLRGKLLEGKNGLLDVTFAKTEIRYRGNLEVESPRHDVAMIKINPLQGVPKVELFDSYDQIKAGQTIVILGYPGISPEVGVRPKSQDPFNRTELFKVVPNPTVSGGLVGKVIRGAQSAANREERDYVSEFGDSIQLAASSTGAGNSGGPVFDDRGRVIGIFYAGAYRPGDALITFAVPIRYALDMMRNSPVLK